MLNKDKYFDELLDWFNKLDLDETLLIRYKDIFLNVDNEFITNYLKYSSLSCFILNCIHTLNRIANAKAENGLDYAKEDKLIAQLEKIKISSRYVSL